MVNEWVVRICHWLITFYIYSIESSSLIDSWSAFTWHKRYETKPKRNWKNWNLMTIEHDRQELHAQEAKRITDNRQQTAWRLKLALHHTHRNNDTSNDKIIYIKEESRMSSRVQIFVSLRLWVWEKKETYELGCPPALYSLRHYFSKP